MPARRRSPARRRGSKTASGGIPAWFWLLGGILIGLGTALALMFKGYLPELKQRTPARDEPASVTSEPALVEEDDKGANSEPEKPRYDFFTVLPEMEVVVPEQELSRKADRPASGEDTVPVDSQDNYLLQAGSFRNAADAEQMKASLALLGAIARVQTVTVDGQTWHRVRIGPIRGARQTDEVRRLLSDNQIDTLVMKASE